jgi:hypothetical protein
LWGQAEEDDAQEKILSIFYPYRQGLPQMEGITLGMKIDQTNFQVAEEVLPPKILKYLQTGDFAITVQETTDTPLREEYIKTTLEHYTQVELENGELKSYMAGLPFPLIDPQDPKAGEKVAWNYRYRDRGETTQYWPTNELRNRSGAVERTESFYVAFMYGLHRPEPGHNHGQWEKEEVFHKRYMRTLSPADAEGSQVLTYFSDKDALANEQWVYDPKTRRTRKVVYNQYQSAGGGELLMEDTSGFSGYIYPYEWKYLGERVVLAPGPVRAAESTWGGKGNWYPLDPWELRRAVVVEARPKKSHPVYSHRVLYLDLQTYVALYSLTYDRDENHKRTFLLVHLHPDFNPWNSEVRVPRIAAQLSIDYQRGRASIFQTHKVIHNEPLDEKIFKTSALLRYGK